MDTITNRFVKQCEIAMSCKWQAMPFRYQKHPNSLPSKPTNLSQMLQIAEILSVTKYVRVDLYNVNKRVFVGEFTFTPAGGTDIFTPTEWDRKLGDLWKM
ncbi:ATP-grasp fold amidoligase family protein [Helicobacter sp. 23-1044]